MKPLFLSFILALGSLPVIAQIVNIPVDVSGNPNEPHIAIDPRNPGRMVAGANIDNVYTSSDSGRTWVKKRLTSSFGVWGDPIITVDSSGSFYFFHLSNAAGVPLPSNNGWIDRMVCQRMDGFSGTWNNGSYAGLDTPRKQDKPSVAYDAARDKLYLAWTQFDRYGSPNPNDSSVILLSTSSDRGVSWSSPVRLSTKGGDCLDDDGTVEGAVPAVSPNGDVYVVWAAKDALKFKRSTDGGQTWPVLETLIDAMPGGWAFNIPGISRCNGFPFLACDLSSSPHRGTLYVNWSDQRNGASNTDIWLSRSTDGGATWSPALRVNDDTGSAHQFMNSMAVDQSTGYIYILFYDRRDESLPNETEVYLAVSKDGGLSFTNEQISQTPFRPSASRFFGDYTGIAATNGIIRPVWARMDGGLTSIWTALLNPAPDTALGVPGVAAAGNRFDAVYPNPFSSYAQLPVTISAADGVTIRVVDVYGRTAATVQKGIMPAGNHTIRFEPAAHGLVQGTYFLELTAGGERFVRKVVYAPGR